MKNARGVDSARPNANQCVDDEIEKAAQQMNRRYFRGDRTSCRRHRGGERMHALFVPARECRAPTRMIPVVFANQIGKKLLPCHERPGELHGSHPPRQVRPNHNSGCCQILANAITKELERAGRVERYRGDRKPPYARVFCIGKIRDQSAGRNRGFADSRQPDWGIYEAIERRVEPYFE